MIKLVIEDYLEDYPYWRSVTVPIEDKQLFIDGIHELGLDWKLGHEDGNGRIGLKIYGEQEDLSDLADYVDSRKGKTESFGRRKLREQDVEIEVKNKGILEVPEDKNVDDLPMSHFEKLVKKHGLSKITKALNNLQVWNKNDDKKLSKWAGDMIDKLTKKYGKSESISGNRFNEGWHNGDAIITFTHNDDLEADLEEFLFDLFSDNPDVFDFDWFGKNTTLYLSCSEDDYKYIKWFIEDWKYKHRDEYDESLKEGLDSDCYELTNALKKLGYTCGEPFDVFGKKMCSCSKFYDRGNGEYGDGIEVSIDPCDGTVELRDYYLDDDLELCDENITRMCPVRKALTADDISKIDRWVKKNMYFRSDREW